MSERAPALGSDALRRYSRQILLDEIGPAGQQRLAAARVLIVGAGGLGSPAALYLAAAGVGTLGIADHDKVELHNLHRQLLHRDADVGHAKVDSAAATLSGLNPHIEIITHPDGVTPANVVELFGNYDVIVDGTDNFSVRYLNNDAAHLTGKPLVHGSIFKFEGLVTVFDTARGGPCYRCLHPEAPDRGSVPGCGEAGVVGALCGVIGSLQAMETIKLITGCGPALRGRLFVYEALSVQTQTLTIERNKRCPLCGRNPQITSIAAAAYQPTCTVAPSFQTMNQAEYPFEIDVAAAHQMTRESSASVIIIDVREPHELEICRVETARHIPMRQIPEHAAALPRDKHLLIMCHHGGRSRRVTEYLRAQGFDAVTNIAGGIDAWAVEIDSSLSRY
ncbi:MAG: molybdopterin-synthase adenylyltransferase MoeB [Opitutaceae bacterium]|nr:molybdopterin-synthase adenylyltransferase MoeB [Opitutaceae bacterium]